MTSPTNLLTAIEVFFTAVLSLVLLERWGSHFQFPLEWRLFFVVNHVALPT